MGYTIFGATWFYWRGEYHIEAYDVQLGRGGSNDQVEISDLRSLFGFRTEGGNGTSAFIEAGWVFDRDMDFKTTRPNLDIDTGFIGRMGLRF